MVAKTSERDKTDCGARFAELPRDRPQGCRPVSPNRILLQCGTKVPSKVFHIKMRLSIIPSEAATASVDDGAVESAIPRESGASYELEPT